MKKTLFWDANSQEYSLSMGKSLLLKNLHLTFMFDFNFQTLIIVNSIRISTKLDTSYIKLHLTYSILNMLRGGKVI